MKQSAGILLFRHVGAKVEVLLSHPGGQFWAKKDDWSIPKGETKVDEDLLSAARREFKEELGSTAPTGEYIELGLAKSSAKTNYIWAVESDFNVKTFHCDSMVMMDWPPKSGKVITFPEVDKVAWFELGLAQTKIFKNQIMFIERLAQKLDYDLSASPDDAPDQQSLL